VSDTEPFIRPVPPMGKVVPPEQMVNLTREEKADLDACLAEMAACRRRAFAAARNYVVGGGS
jgi:hypothetical protein